MGRPSMRTPELEAAILAGLAEGKFLTQVCAAKGMPAPRTVDQWTERDPEFARAYVRARARGARGLVEAGLKILDDCDGTEASQVSKARERAAYRRWLAGCYDRATFGDRQGVEVSGPSGGPITQKVAHEFSDEHYAALIRTAQAAGFVANGAAHPAPAAPPLGGAAAGAGNVAG